MKVDRAHFLQLVALVHGATACSSKPPPPANAVAPVELARPEPAVTATAAPVATSAPVASSTAEVANASGAEGIWKRSAPTSTHSCKELKCPHPSQEGFQALRDECAHLAKSLRPEVFQRFMACVMKVNNTPMTCGLGPIGTGRGECLEGWASPPTFDAASEATCKPIVSKCKGALSMEKCRGLFSVTTKSSEPKMVHCAAEYCDTDLCHYN